MAKKIVSRGGQKILGSLPSGTGDPVLTLDSGTKEVGEIPSIDPSSYLTAALPSGYIYLGNGAGVATQRQLSGAITLSNTGVASISPNVITNNEINAAAAISYGKLNLTNSISNPDINASAGIARTKLASGTLNRIVVNNASGVMTDAAAITAARVLISDANGIPTHSSITSTTLAYLDPTSSVQTQLNNRLAFSSGITPVTGDVLYYSGAAWVNLAVGINGQVLTLSGGIPSWQNGASNGIPTAGTTHQILRKIDNTNYNTEWHTLVAASLTDVTSTAAELNKLTGVTTTAAQFNYLNTLSSNVQTQLNNKLGTALAFNAIFVGDFSGQATQLGPGADGYVLTSVGGVPQWTQPVGGTTRSAGDLTTTNATTTIGLTIPIASGDSITGLCWVVVRNPSTGSTSTYHGNIAAKNVSGTITYSSSFPQLLSDLATSVTLSTIGNDLFINGTGIAATTLEWRFFTEYITV